MIEIPVTVTPEKMKDIPLFVGAIVIPDGEEALHLRFSKPLIASVASAMAKAYAFDREYTSQDVDWYLIAVDDIITVEME